MLPSWEHYRHGADVGVRGRGPTPAAAFEQAALAVTALLTDTAAIRERDTIAIHCRARDPRMLLVDFLNEVVFELSAHRRVLGRFEVRINDETLDARAWGEPFDASRHEAGVDVKGVTFTTLEVRRDADGWRAQCVVDV